MTIARPFPGRLPVSRRVVLGFALVLAGPVSVASIARAEEVAEAREGAAAPTPTFEAPTRGEQDARIERERARAEMNGMLARMTSASRQVREMLRVARRRGTKLQVACLDEKLSRADVARRTAQARADESLIAYGRNDLVVARAAWVRVTELGDVQRIAVRDADACVPKPVPQIVPSGTSVRLTVDPKVASVSLQP